MLAISHEAPDGDALGCLSAFLLVCERPGNSVLRPTYPARAPSLPNTCSCPVWTASSEARSPSVGPGDDGVLLRLRLAASFEFTRVPRGGHAGQHRPPPGQPGVRRAESARCGERPRPPPFSMRCCKAGGFPVSAEVATGLYVGLVTDTGRFQYSNTTPGAHRMAAELQEAGVDVASVYRRGVREHAAAQAAAAGAGARPPGGAAGGSLGGLVARTATTSPRQAPTRATPRGSSTRCAGSRGARWLLWCGRSPAGARCRAR